MDKQTSSTKYNEIREQTADSYNNLDLKRTVVRSKSHFERSHIAHHSSVYVTFQKRHDYYIGTKKYIYISGCQGQDMGRGDDHGVSGELFRVMGLSRS